MPCPRLFPGVRGVGAVSEKDVDAHDVKTGFQHELDFWLKSGYRPKSREK